MGLFWGTNFTSFFGYFVVADERGESEKWGRPACPSSKSSHFQNEAKCETSLWKWGFAWDQNMIVISIASLWNKGLVQLADGLLLKHVS